MSRGANPCPCDSGRLYRDCCRPVHQGLPAETAEALMRSRYSAYALGFVEHILATTHPRGPHWMENRAAWEKDVATFCAETEFLGLEVLDQRESKGRGMVQFRARMRGPGGDAEMVERSRFERVNGRWLYHSGVTG